MRLLWALLVLLSAVPALAQRSSISVRLERERAFVGEPVRLSIELILGGSLQSLEAPPLDGFDVVAGQWPPQTPRVMISGGSFRVPLNDIYLTATRPGTLTLGAFRVRAGGEEIESQVLSFEALPRPDGVPTSGPSSRPSDRYDDPLVGLPEAPLSPMVVHAVPDRDEVYPGGLVVVTYWLLVSPGTRFGDVDVEAPEAKGAVQREVVPFDQRRFEGRSIAWGSQPYNAFRLGRIGLSPIGTEPIQVSPLVFRGIAGGAFGEPVERPSERLEIPVRPLPPGPPKADHLAVGQFTLSLQAGTTEARAGEPFPVSVVLAGRGDLSSYTPGPWTGLVGARARPPAVKRDESFNDETQLLSRVEAQYFVIPDRAGELTLRAPPVAVFDPEAGAWGLAEAEPLLLTVTGSARVTEALGLRAARSVSSLGAPALPSAWVLGLGLSLPPLVVALLFVWEARRRGLRGRVHAWQPVDDLLQEAARAPDPASTYRALVSALVRGAELASGRSLGAATNDELADAIAATAGEPLGARARRFLQAADLARFAPSQPKDAREEAQREARALLEPLRHAPPAEVRA